MTTMVGAVGVGLGLSRIHRRRRFRWHVTTAGDIIRLRLIFLFGGYCGSGSYERLGCIVVHVAVNDIDVTVLIDLCWYKDRCRTKCVDRVVLLILIKWRSNIHWHCRRRGEMLKVMLAIGRGRH